MEHWAAGGDVEEKERNGLTNAGTCTSVVLADGSAVHSGGNKKAAAAESWTPISQRTSLSSQTKSPISKSPQSLVPLCSDHD